jgi:hypothetical protein
MAYSKIRIIKTPPGFAPEEIGNQWVGIEIPLATDSEIEANPPSGLGIGNSNMGGSKCWQKKQLQHLSKLTNFRRRHTGAQSSPLATLSSDKSAAYY